MTGARDDVMFEAELRSPMLIRAIARSRLSSFDPGRRQNATS